jgi:hypothetical protein
MTGNCVGGGAIFFVAKATLGDEEKRRDHSKIIAKKNM